MSPRYPDVTMAVVALRRANGVPVEDAVEWALARYWRQFGDLRAFIRDVAPPQPALGP